MSDLPTLPDQRCEIRRESDLEITTTLGKLKANGITTILAIFAFSFGLAILWQLQKHDTNTNAVITELIEAQKGTNYILTLSPAEREKLQLDKPKAIRDMERTGRYGDR